jgi:hypothetical protein
MPVMVFVEEAEVVRLRAENASLRADNEALSASLVLCRNQHDNALMELERRGPARDPRARTRKGDEG